MLKIILSVSALAVLASPAFSQTQRPDDRDSYMGRRDRDYSLYRRDRDDGDGQDRGDARRGARFMVRSGDTAVSVRCDGGEPMRACVDATVTLIERMRSLPAAASSTANPGPTNQPAR